jgi:autotransporter-associated beta strand protein
LEIGSATALGSGTLTIGGGTLQSLATRTITNALAINGSFALGGSYDLTQSAGGIALGGSPTITVGSAARTLTLGGAIGSTANSITKDGLGTLTLGGSNGYRGLTTVSGGTLALSGTGTLGTSTISIEGGTFDMGGKSLTNPFGMLADGTLANGTLTNNGSNYDLRNGTVSAILAGTNGINKTTAGTVTLTGNNTYSGTRYIKTAKTYNTIAFGFSCIILFFFCVQE